MASADDIFHNGKNRLKFTEDYEVKNKADFPFSIIFSKIFLVDCLPHDISDVLVLRISDNMIKNSAHVTEFIFDAQDNIAGKGENAGFQHFLLFP